MYNVGDKFIINRMEYTIWLVDPPVYHLLNSEGHGICCDEDYLTNLNLPN